MRRDSSGDGCGRHHGPPSVAGIRVGLFPRGASAPASGRADGNPGTTGVFRGSHRRVAGRGGRQAPRRRGDRAARDRRRGVSSGNRVGDGGGIDRHPGLVLGGPGSGYAARRGRHLLLLRIRPRSRPFRHRGPARRDRRAGSGMEPRGGPARYVARCRHRRRSSAGTATGTAVPDRGRRSARLRRRRRRGAGPVTG